VGTGYSAKKPEFRLLACSKPRCRVQIKLPGFSVFGFKHAGRGIRSGYSEAAILRIRWSPE
jgi:hypothetical protein